MSPNPTLKFSLCAAAVLSLTLRWPISQGRRLLLTGEIGGYVAEVAPGVNTVLAFLGKVQHNFPLQKIHVDVSEQAVNVYFPGIVVLVDDPGIRRRLDAVLKIEAHFSAYRMKGEETPCIGDNPL